MYENENLYKETMGVLKEFGKRIKDIRYVNYGNYTCSNVKKCLRVLKKIDYDSSLGLVEINETLQIVGDDWWLERASYDGSEWWEFKTLPIKFDERVITESDVWSDYGKEKNS